jgi:hypothetical protein
MLLGLAGLHEKQDRLADAEAMYKEALRIKELKLGRESLDVAGTLTSAALFHIDFTVTFTFSHTGWGCYVTNFGILAGDAT